jgi:ribosomal protein S13
VRSSAVLGALLLIAVASAPLADRAWELFWSRPHAGRLALCAVGVAVIVAATVRRPHLQWRRRAAQARLGSLIAIAWTVVIAVVMLLVAGAWWVMGAPTLDFPETVQPRALDALATRAFAIVAGLGAAALLVIHYRRQRTTEADAEREVSKLFTDTFDSASDKLGSEHAAVRLAGVHALARLADEAPEGREDLVQMVIDVLCAYLRMPYATPPDPELLLDGTVAEQTWEDLKPDLEFGSFREVRHTILRVIGDRLRENTRWRGKNYNFTGVVFDGGDLNGAVFSGGRVSFSLSRFADGLVGLNHVQFTGGRVLFTLTEFSGGLVSFQGAQFAGAEVSFQLAVFKGGTVLFRDASGACPEGLLAALEGAEPEVVVVLPEHWRPAADGNGEWESSDASADTSGH